MYLCSRSLRAAVRHAARRRHGGGGICCSRGLDARRQQPQGKSILEFLTLTSLVCLLK